VVTFSKPVMNVTRATLLVTEGSCAGQPLAGAVSSNPAGDVWTFRPVAALSAASHCVRVTAHVYDLEGQGLVQPVQSQVTPAAPAVTAAGSPSASQPPSHD
jgi:hypothetical protein